MNKNQLLLGYVRDVVAVENELHAAFRRQKHDDTLGTFPHASAFVGRAEDSIDRHLAQLRALLAKRNESESTLKSAIGSVLGAAAGVVDKVRPEDPVSRILRDDYTAVSFAVICYEMLHVTALAAEDAEVAELALAHLRDYAPIVMGLSDLIPHVIVDELTREGKLVADRGVAEQAVRNTCSVWTAPAE